MINYFVGSSFAELYAPDTAAVPHAFLLMYPSTAAWSAYPNTQTYIIQDGNEEHLKVGFDKVCQREAWKNTAVLGNAKAIAVAPPPQALLDYWQETFGTVPQLEILPPKTYLDTLNQAQEKLITLFPYDHLRPERHAVDPAQHYFLLSKLALNQIVSCAPRYTEYHFSQTHPNDVDLPKTFPYVIKTSHGLSGEGTYLIRSQEDLDNCRKEFRAYWELKLVEAVVVSDFVPNVVDNYCVQFYVGKKGDITLLGATHQLVTETGVYLGGLIHFEENISKFEPIIREAARFIQSKGYFGVVGLDVLEDREGGLHVIDANVRINGSTPLCLQRNRLLKVGKETAKYAGNWVIKKTLAEILTDLKEYLHRLDFIILSALEYPETQETALYGIVAGENWDDLVRIEQELALKGLVQR